jgi:hypothetical protein
LADYEKVVDVFCPTWAPYMVDLYPATVK